MERYEFKDGASQKFWEVWVEGDTLTVRFGKIGTNGQTKEKSFDSAAAAEKEKTKLIKEKTGKGYAAAGAAQSPAPASPPAAKPNKQQVAPAQEETAPPSAEVEAKAPRAPRPLILGDRIVKQSPLPTRTRPAPALSTNESATALSDMLTSKAKTSPTWPEHLASFVPPAEEDAAAIAKHMLEIEAVATGPLGYRNPKDDGRPVAMTMCRAYGQWLVSARGAPFVMDVANAIVEERQTHRVHYAAGGWSFASLLGLRAAMSSAPAASYDTALHHCLARCVDTDWPRNAYTAFVLADDRSDPHPLQMLSVLEAAAAQGVEVGAQVALAPLIAESPAPSAWRAKRTYFMYYAYAYASAAEIALTAASAANARGESPLPVLDWLLYYATDDDKTAIACVILDTHDDDALALLAPLLHEKPVRAALDSAVDIYPDWTFQRMLELLGAARAEPSMRARAMKVIETHGLETTRSWATAIGGRAQTYYDALAAAGAQEMARTDDLPSFLRAPPWREKKQAASDDIVVQVEERASPLTFKPGRVAEPHPWVKSALMSDSHALVAFLETTERDFATMRSRVLAPSVPLPNSAASESEVLAWLSRRLDEIHTASRYALGGYGGLINGVHFQPDALALTLWNKPSVMQLGWGIDWESRITKMLTRFGEGALPGLVKIVEADPTTLLPFVQDVDTPALAPIAARAFLKLKKARATGRAWLKSHPRAAVLGLVPAAVGKSGEARDAAEYALRFLKVENPDALQKVIAEFAGDEAQINAAIEQVLSRDPFSRTPSKVAKPPAWLSISSLSRPELKAGGALPNEAMTALVEMLSFVNPADVYPGVFAFREACTPDSLARFSWDLFSAWLAEGAPSKEGWAFRALGWFGDDECARQLTRLVRKWPGESAHARAVTGLDVLADIGTDVALMNLNGVAEKVKFKGLQDRARDKIAALAEARELSPEELADRLAPDLDLDDRGGLDLDFGPRQFRAGFDEFLKPWVKDETGARLKDLPKPSKSDDVDKAKEASAKWAALKKDARAIASLQLARLETMLATGRRSKPEVFHTFFASHPLIRHLAQRLVWGMYETDQVDAGPRLYFRVGEDLSFTDANDDSVTIDVSANAPGFV
ncbi:MAG: DUF4132 domain-containing protein, partial [Terricaulis sp.]